MKTSVLVVVVVVAAIVIMGLIAVLVVTINNNQTAINKTAEEEFQSQIEKNWNQILSALKGIELRLGDEGNLRHYCVLAVGDLDKMMFEKISVKYKERANEFKEKVQQPTRDLFALMTDKLTEEQAGLIQIRAQDLDRALQNYADDHKDLERPVQVATYLSAKVKALVKKATPPSTKIVVFNYPGWVSTPIQRQAWDTMYGVARDYFAERTRLGKALNWTYGRANPSYFAYSDVQQILAGAISTREAMLSRLNAIENVEGMSSLSASIREMLNNSISGLQCLYQNGDYRTFKAYNNHNDAIAARIRRTFGIR